MLGSFGQFESHSMTKRDLTRKSTNAIYACLHLRRCAACGHIGCCDSSPAQHASHHAAADGHPVAQSFEPGEDWFWDYVLQDEVQGPTLAPPHSHPRNQPVPGPRGRVPHDWTDHLH